jgi:DNA invertase Pin-like site-specific DNA recombinase
MSRRDGNPLVIDLYGRVSHKKDPRYRSVDGQLAVGRDVVDERGHTVGHEWRDDGRSAWQPNGRRPGWDQLMRRLTTGEAHGAFVFDLTRFSRRAAEGMPLLAAAERGLIILSETDQLDLGTPSGRKTFRDLLSAAEYESDMISKRVRRGKDAKARAGELWWGPRGAPYPFRADGTHHPDEVEICREAAQRLLDPPTEALNAIVRDLNRRQVPTRRGAPWGSATLRGILMSPRMIGKMSHKGEVVGPLRRPVVDPTTLLVDSWVDVDPVLDEITYARLCALFARRAGRPATAAYLLSGTITCGRCGRGLAGRVRSPDARYTTARREYTCRVQPGRSGCGRLCIDAEAVERHLTALALRRLEDPRIAGELAAVAEQTSELLAQAREQLAEAERVAVEMARRLGAGLITLERHDAALSGLESRMRNLRAVIAGAAAPAPRIDPADVRRRWESAGAAGQRELMRLAFHGYTIEIMPAVVRHRIDMDQRVRITPSDAGG